MLHKMLFVLLLSFTAQLSFAQDIVYLTDLEGSQERLLSFYQDSGAFELGSDGKYHLKEDHIFVFGGDAIGRYYGSIWILEELLRHHNENPGRMFSIAGNREIMQMRLPLELSPQAVAQPPWPYHFIKQEAYDEHAAKQSTQAERLQFMLKFAMGSPDTFKLLRREIAERKGLLYFQVNDAEVTQFYLEMLSPTGLMTQFLKKNQLTLKIGNTLFLHGGSSPENLGHTPGHPRTQSYKIWASRLNSWFQTEVNDWSENAHTWNGRGERPGEDLLAYPLPLPGQGTRQDSVVTARHVDSELNPLLPATEAIAWLQKQGIQREIVGHNPVGHSAVIARTKNAGFESIFADVSYSTDQSKGTWIKLIGPDYKVSQVSGHVLTSEGEWKSIQAKSVLGKSTHFGKSLSDGFRIIGSDEEGKLVATRTEKFKIMNRFVSPSELGCKSITR